jgi:hypothetical protein
MGKPTFDIDVVCPGGNTITITALKLLNNTDGPTVADLKAEIETRTDVPVDQQILHTLTSNFRRKVGNHKLRNYLTLRHYKIGAARHVLSMSLVQQRPQRVKRPAETIVWEEDLSEGDSRKDDLGESNGVEGETLHEISFPVQKKSCKVVQERGWRRILRLGWRRPSR